MTDPTVGDSQAASGGRRNIPLVASLPKAIEWADMVDKYGITREPDGRWCLRLANIDPEAGTALGFNVNREWVGH